MLDTILKQIDDVYKKIQSDQNDPSALLKDANSLSTLMYNVGDIYVNARSEADHSETKYKDELDESFLETMKAGSTIEKAKTEARVEHKELKQDWLDKVKVERKLSTLRSDVNAKISVLQSYASELRSRKMYKDL